MSAAFRCDWPHCKHHRFGVTGTFDGYMWTKPKGWLAFPLDDFEVHGCCREHYERALALGDGRTPVTQDPNATDA